MSDVSDYPPNVLLKFKKEKDERKGIMAAATSNGEGEGEDQKVVETVLEARQTHVKCTLCAINLSSKRCPNKHCEVCCWTCNHHKRLIRRAEAKRTAREAAN